MSSPCEALHAERFGRGVVCPQTDDVVSALHFARLRPEVWASRWPLFSYWTRQDPNEGGPTSGTSDSFLLWAQAILVDQLPPAQEIVHC